MYIECEWKSDIYYNFKYAQYLPKDFDNTKQYPLVLFLHGAGERGDDLNVATRHGYMKYVREEGREYPFICIAPQCPSMKYWACYTESLLAFLDYLEDSLPIDKKRVYVTGFSMGGMGTVMLAMADPDRFAAIAPVCAFGASWNGAVLKNIPVLMYHGDCDSIVPISESVKILAEINKYGGRAQLKICYGVGHNAWDYAYTDDTLIDWMMEKHL